MHQPSSSIDSSPIGAYRFGVFELDVREGELRKQGRLIRLRGQPLQILLALLERPGAVVTREELRQRLWPDDTFVEFDQSLNTAIKRLREALGDIASTPRFVETIPRKGYRFAARVDPIASNGAGANGTASSSTASNGTGSNGAGSNGAGSHGAHITHDAHAAHPTSVTPVVHDEPGRRRSGRMTLAAVAAVILCVAVAGALTLVGRGSPEVTTAAEARAPRVAVLPFQNLSGDEGRAHVAAGFTEELISQLGRLAPGRLGVIARSSSATFAPALSFAPAPSSAATSTAAAPSTASTASAASVSAPATSSASTTASAGAAAAQMPAPSLEEIGRALDADYIIEGSVRAQGDQYRVAVRLVRARDAITLWSELHEGALLDLMAMQRDVGEQVARHLAVAVLPADRAALARATTADSRAYEDYLRGVSELARGPVEGFAGAQAAFEQAIARDPAYALAHAGLAETFIRQQDYYIIAPEHAQRTARPAAERALALDDSLAEAHCALADVFSRGEGQSAAAEREFARAIALNPSRAETHLRYSSHLERIGRPREARARLTLARTLAPRSADVLTEAAWLDMHDGRLDAAAALADEALRYQPDFPFARYVLGQLALRRSAAKDAVAQFERARVTSGQAPKYLAALATAYLADGRRDDAVSLLEMLTAQSRDRYVPPDILAALAESLREPAGHVARGSR